MNTAPALDGTEDALQTLKSQNPDALRLAVFASLAMRVEPALLRLLRRRLLPHADPSAEIDLWFSALVQARSSTAVQFSLPVLQRLRQALADEPRRAEAAALTRRLLANAHPLARAELELNALPVLDATVTDARLAQALAPLLDELRGGGAPALDAARWLLQAAPRWHERVRGTGAAWAAMHAASALVGGRRLAGGSAPAGIDPALLAGLPAPAPSHDIGVAMSRRRLDFVPAGAPGSATVRVPGAWPALVVLQFDRHPPQLVSAVEGASAALPGVAALDLRNLDGSGWRLQALPATARSAAKAPRRARLDARVGEGTLHLEIQWTGGGRVAPQSAWRMPAPTAWWPRLDAELTARVAEGQPDAVWQVPVEAGFWDALATLRDAEVIELTLDHYLAPLPWEALLLPGKGDWEAEAIGARMLRTLPPGVRQTPVGHGAALLVSSWPGEPLPQALRDAHDWLQAALQRDSRLQVQRLQPEAAAMVLPALQAGSVALLHWSSRALAPGSTVPWPAEPGPGEPFGQGFRLRVTDLEALPSAPEVAVLDLEPGGLSAVHGDSPHPRASDGRAPSPVDELLRLGVPMLATLAGHAAPQDRSQFTRHFHARLLAGGTLLEATLAARRAVHDGGGPPMAWSTWQVFGAPDRRASYARPAGLPGPAQRAAERVLVALADQGEVMAPVSGLRLGPGLVVTARAAVGQIPFLVGSGQGATEVLAVDPPFDDNPVATALPVDEPAGPGRPPPVAALAPEAPDGHFSAEVWALVDGRARITKVRCTPGRPITGEPPRDWLLQPAHAQASLPALCRGAALMWQKRCVGLVVGETDDGRWVACGPQALHAALAQSQRLYVARRLQAHAQWLDSDGRSGRRFVADGADLAGFDLRGTRLQRASLVGTVLRGADLRDAQLDGADLRRADLREATLLGSSRRGTQLQQARLEGAQLGHDPDDPPPRLRGGVYLVMAASSNHPPLIEGLQDLLRDRGLILWTDQPLLPGKVSADQTVRRRLAECEAALVLWNTAAAQSRWVQEELAVLRQRQIPMLVCTLDGAPVAEADLARLGLDQTLRHNLRTRTDPRQDPGLVKAVHDLAQRMHATRAA